MLVFRLLFLLWQNTIPYIDIVEIKHIYYTQCFYRNTHSMVHRQPASYILQTYASIKLRFTRRFNS